VAKASEKMGKNELLCIYEISKIMGSSLDTSKTLREVLNFIASQREIRRGMISLMHEDGDLHLLGAVGLSEEEYSRGSFHVGEGVTGRIFQTGMPAVLRDVAREPLYLNRTGSLDQAGEERIAFVGVPIRVQRETLGVLSIDFVVADELRSFDEDVRFLTMVANLVGQTVRLHELVVSERNRLVEQQRQLKRPAMNYSLDNVIGVSRGMQRVFGEVHQSAPSRATVLLRGESGVGKEVIARAIHYLSPRRDGPFIRVNCAALSETLLESELFGHEKGAFTGAQSERKGRFELAHGGTLFLDEIGDISPAFQAKLLRVLQEREFERVGGNRSIKVDVRIVTATNRDLERAVAKNEFRADLYYRINVVSITIPPLRERREDIPFLVEYFIDKFNRENKRQLKVHPEAMAVFMHCYWPGNVRELENCVERTATMVSGDEIRSADFLCQHNRCLTRTLHESLPGLRVVPAATTVEHHVDVGDIAVLPVKPLARVSDEPPPGERDRLIWALEQCGWVQAKAARLLNISARQMGYALQKFNIEVKKF
jgi:Nif-specific regulatory protein